MIVRVWTVGIADGMTDKLETFANEISLPMFRKLPGCLGVLFTRRGNVCATITMWDSDESIKALDSSRVYQSVVRAIEESGILEGKHGTEVYHTYGGFLSDDLATSQCTQISG